MNRGFTFDAGDPSVGLFGHEWLHEECPAPDGPDEEVIEQELATVRIDGMTIRTYWLLTCADCAQQVIVSEDDWSPTEDEYRREAEAERAAWEAEARMVQYDDDPSPYAGTYSEE